MRNSRVHSSIKLALYSATLFLSGVASAQVPLSIDTVTPNLQSYFDCTKTAATTLSGGELPIEVVAEMSHKACVTEFTRLRKSLVAFYTSQVSVADRYEAMMVAEKGLTEARTRANAGVLQYLAGIRLNKPKSAH